VPVVFLQAAIRSELLDLLEAAEDGLVGQVIKFFAAEIVVASLHVNRRSVCCRCSPKRVRSRKGTSFLESCSLKILVPVEIDDALAGTRITGQQIGECLAGARASLHDRCRFSAMASSYGLGHLELAAAKFVGGVVFESQAAGSEELVERESPAREKRDGSGRHGESL